MNCSVRGLASVKALSFTKTNSTQRGTKLLLPQKQLLLHAPVQVALFYNPICSVCILKYKGKTSVSAVCSSTGLGKVVLKRTQHPNVTRLWKMRSQTSISFGKGCSLCSLAVAGEVCPASAKRLKSTKKNNYFSLAAPI